MPETEAQPQQPHAAAGVSMHDLLAACAAARVISTPPRAPEPQAHPVAENHREAA
ncbi:hypothetical protein GCM10010377_39140 [Streptomyces viridiviolaceus]|uniref:Uncharacterized protein n=1 Tax=Streptomyces viridiviolaceus TaxID=68282 RepID=A0ABW2DZ83_9ACTN|nr:hypothetical protein [Streptomyces viridiviolaceus]GHB44347.1 hypothetical protein GCM10010377_39140 [Streptomyces viridiviolaceus]